MKSCKTITGTVVIEIEKGLGLGEVHEVFVDEGVNLTFVIKSKQSAQPFALLSSKNIQGIGDFAVMVENSSVFQDLDEADLQVLNEKQGSIFDEIVITIDGNKVGTVVDYHIDEKNEIGYLVVNPEDAGEEIQIPKSRILMIGKEYIILNDEKKSAVHLDADAELGRLAAADLLKEKEAAAPAPAEVVLEKAAEKTVEVEAEEPVFEPIATAEAEVPADLEAALKSVGLEEKTEPVLAEASQSETPKAEEFFQDLTEQVSETEDFFQELTEQVTEAMEQPTFEASDLPSLDAALEEVLAVPAQEEEAVLEAAPAEEVETTIGTAAVTQTETAENAVNEFISQQKRLLVGKKLQKDLVNADGGVILYAGDTVTDDIIDFLRRIDRKFLIRLAECVV